MTNKTNKMLHRDRKRWRIKQLDELDDGELDEQKCTQKIGILPGPTKKWRIKRIDELNDDEWDEFYCIHIKFVEGPLLAHLHIIVALFWLTYGLPQCLWL